MQTNDSLQALDRQLDTLLAMLEQGDWDDLPEIDAPLMQALAAVRTSGNRRDKAALESLLGKLGRAIAACSQRKAQIEPLVNALATTQPKPVKA